MYISQAFNFSKTTRDYDEDIQIILKSRDVAVEALNAKEQCLKDEIMLGDEVQALAILRAFEKTA